MEKEGLQTKQNNWLFFDGYDLEGLRDTNLFYDKRDVKQQILNFLLRERLSNYGYLYPSWKRIQRQRGKAKAILRLADIEKLKWVKLGNGFQINSETNEIRYIVCQSRNEELTRVMRRLIGLKGWAS